jgi:hypothetical protein
MDWTLWKMCHSGLSSDKQGMLDSLDTERRGVIDPSTSTSEELEPLEPAMDIASTDAVFLVKSKIAPSFATTTSIPSTSLIDC